MAGLGGRDAREGMLCCWRQTPVRGCLMRQPSKCCSGVLWFLDMPAVLRNNVKLLVPASLCVILALHQQHVLEVRDEGEEEEELYSPGSLSQHVSEGSPQHFWITGYGCGFHTNSVKMERGGGVGPALGTEFIPMDFSAGRNMA